MVNEERVLAYQKKKQSIALISTFLTPILLWLVVATPLSSKLGELAHQFEWPYYGILATYFLFFSLWMLLFDAPLSFYSGYVLEKEYDLSNETPVKWALDFIKKAMIGFAFYLALLELFYFILNQYENNWWVICWAIFVFVSYVVGLLFPVFIVPLFFKYEDIENVSLVEKITTLANKHGMSIQRICSIDLSRKTKKANAALMGLGKTRRVVLGDTLLSEFDDDEVTSVVAHELGHFVHKDLWRQLIFGSTLSLIAFWLIDRFANPFVQVFGFGDIKDVAAMPAILLLLTLFYLTLMPVQSGFSRWREREADRFALCEGPGNEVYAHSMEKLGNLNMAHPAPNPLYVFFFYSHPPIRERIQMARDFVA